MTHVIADKNLREKYSKKFIEQCREERQQYKRAHTFGLKKFSDISLDDSRKYEAGLRSLQMLGMMMETSVYQEKEKDWAIRGGLANGIGGIGAGIVTAVDTMRQNDRIRSENEARREWGARQNQMFQELAAEAASKAPDYLPVSALEKKYIAITAWSPYTLMEKMSIFLDEVVVDNQTGAVTVFAKWQSYNRELCIDGAFRAKLYTPEGQCAGCAYLVLPKTGTAQFKGRMNGVCAAPKHADSYQVKFEPVDLWELAAKGTEDFPRAEKLTQEEHEQIVRELEANYLAELDYPDTVAPLYKDFFLARPEPSESDWQCCCGRINFQYRNDCTCGNPYTRKAAEEKAAVRQAMREQMAKEQEEQRRKDAAEGKARAKKNRKLAAIITPILVVAIVATVLISGIVQKNNEYNHALSLLEEGEYDEAKERFANLGDFRDSAEQVQAAQSAKLENIYNRAVYFTEHGVFYEAIRTFESLDGYKDSAEQIEKVKSMQLEADYQTALSFLEEKEYEKAKKIFEELGDYKDCTERVSRFVPMLVKETCGFPQNSYSKTYEYDFSGQLIKIATRATLANVEEFFYDDEGKLAKTVKTYDSGKVETSEYDDRGNLVRLTSDGYEANYSYEYDPDGNMLLKRFFEVKNGDTGRIQDWKYSYDDGKLRTTEFFIDEEPISVKRYEYEKNGNCKRELIEYLKGGQIKANKYGYVFDKQNRIALINFVLETGENGMHSYEYDDNGNLIEEGLQISDGAIIHKPTSRLYIYGPCYVEK